MDWQPGSSGNRAFSRNLAIMSFLLFGKVTLSLLLKLFIPDFMIMELLSLAAMAVALGVLLALGTFSSGKEEQRAEGRGWRRGIIRSSFVFESFAYSPGGTGAM